MPLLYGEGEKAFMRLQQQIAQQYADESIFAWTSQNQDQRQAIAQQGMTHELDGARLPRSNPVMLVFRPLQHTLRRVLQVVTPAGHDSDSDSEFGDDEIPVEAPAGHEIRCERGVFAQSPLEFIDAGDIQRVSFRPQRPPFYVVNQRLSMHYTPISLLRHLGVFATTMIPPFIYQPETEERILLGLDCERTTNDPRFGKGIAIVLARLPDESYYRQQSSIRHYYRHRKDYIETTILGGWSRLYITTQVSPPRLIHRPKQNLSASPYSEDMSVIFFTTFLITLLGKMLSRPVALLYNIVMLWASSMAGWEWSNRWLKY